MKLKTLFISSFSILLLSSLNPLSAGNPVAMARIQLAEIEMNVVKDFYEILLKESMKARIDLEMAKLEIRFHEDRDRPEFLEKAENKQ